MGVSLETIFYLARRRHEPLGKGTACFEVLVHQRYDFSLLRTVCVEDPPPSRLSVPTCRFFGRVNKSLPLEKSSRKQYTMYKRTDGTHVPKLNESCSPYRISFHITDNIDICMLSLAAFSSERSIDSDLI